MLNSNINIESWEATFIYIIPSTTRLGPWEFIVDPDIWGLICYSFSCSEIFTDQSRPTRGGSVDKGLAWKYFCSCQKTMLIEIFSLDLSTLTSLSGARSLSFSRTRFPEVKLGFWFLMGSSKFWPDIPFLNIHQLTFEMLCGLEFRGPPSPSEQGGCEHGRPARQTLHSVWNWFWNDRLGNPVGLEWKSHAVGDASLTQMLLGNQFRPIPKGLSLRFGDCQR